ncbi:Galactokinase [Gryllus bimaculatus]|nr:Galactokinase [Gryllus bimaculatus]
MASQYVTEEELLQSAISAHELFFNSPPEVAAAAPGRVNLIGEHTDYNYGFVLPMALPMVTIVAGKNNGTDTCNVVTTSENADMPTSTSFSIPSKEPLQPGIPKWANYVKGVVANFKGDVPGFDAVIVSSVPFGGGVSSSASLEVAVYTFLETLTGQKTEFLVEKALACQKAEHDFAGMPCGIMDQSMEVHLAAMNDPNVVVLVTNSNVHHELSSSEYPTRRKQCEDAAKIIQKKSLRDANEEDLKVLKCRGADPLVIKRARHVVGEIRRTVDGSEALKAGDYATFGKLMIESHNSLRDDYEVSCAELDELVTAALEVEGVLGSRMTGAGFGGCTVTLVQKDAVDATIDNIKKKYSGDATFFVVAASQGSHPIPL